MAIMRNHQKEVSRIQHDIFSKINDVNWVKANNTFNANTNNTASKSIELVFKYTFASSGVFITAAIKKLFEDHKWRVLTDATDAAATITLCR